MDDIQDVTVGPLDKSQYVKLYRVSYEQDKKKKTWDVTRSHDSVAILIHNISRDVFVMVKQFRPAVYIAKAQAKGVTIGPDCSVDTSEHLGSSGLTYELCAGIIDKSLSTAEMARLEVMEEVGYDVPVDKLEKIVMARASVGISGSQQTLYYVQVTDEMKTGQGGGCPDEGELIEAVEVPVKDSLKFAWDESIEKPVGMIFAILWFHQYKLKN